MPVKPNVDQDLCIGCGLCAASHPDIFEINDEGKAQAVNEGDEADVEDAVGSCPVQAIS
ncbi:MAG: ferredoxin [Bacilli bacterium]|nr:ferredoxin [Bacilli bacterium]MBQ4255711.1 ferredoxin [Bacilli bacterium]